MNLKIQKIKFLIFFGWVLHEFISVKNIIGGHD